MIFSVNVNPSYSGGYADPGFLKSVGIAGVSLVSRPDNHQYAWDAKGLGLHVLARIDASSNGHMVPADVYQIGNEPDITSPSSWTMSPTTWINLWNQFRNEPAYSELIMIGPGLASGDTWWWKQVSNKIKGCSGVAVHPYAKQAGTAADLIKQYANVVPKRPVWISEWNRPLTEIRTFMGMLGALCAYASWYCWSDAMVAPMGLVDQYGASKQELSEYTVGLHSWQT